jgi:hypothetical protein
MVLLLVFYAQPFTGWPVRQAAYRLLLLLAAAAHGVDVASRVGPPRLTADYFARAAPDPFGHLVLLPLVFYCAPSPTIMAAFVCVNFDALHALEFVHAAAVRKVPALAARMEAAAAAALPAITRSSPAEVAALSTPAKWTAVNGAMLGFNASVEVVLAISSVFSLLVSAVTGGLFTAAGGWQLLSTAALWMLLQIRWMMSEQTRAAFSEMDAAVSKVTAHPMCPAVVVRWYGALRQFLRARVRSPEQIAAEAAARARAAGGAGRPAPPAPAPAARRGCVVM